MTKNLPEQFLSRMQAELGAEYPAFAACYALAPVRGLRVNTQKLSPEEFSALSPWQLSPAETLPEGFILEEPTPGIGAHPYHLAGLFYLQEPSAMSAIAALNVQPGMKILDLCAAPGGKSGGIAARLQGSGLLVSNEIVPGRAKTLAFNLERLGAVNAAVSCAHPDALCAALPGFFDAVLVDAPCSGEGMFRKDDTAIAEWSLEHVAACAARQRAILHSAALAVAPGGALVYSTCTFSRAENEETIAAFLAEHPDFALEFSRRLYPHQMRGEGHFVCRMARRGGIAAPQPPLLLPPCKDAAYFGFMERAFEAPLPGLPALLPDGRVLLLPQSVRLPAGLSAVRLLSAGVLAGELKKGRFEPAHALFMAHGQACRQRLNFAPDDPLLAKFLAGESLCCPDSLSGYAAVTVSGYPLGFGKASGGQLKNHYPKGLRI